ncbi:hypothetical protein LPJ79_003080 [Coemansia sp. RSA 1821]|nr:hypothetical protein BX667DRAFT_495588 [Coemansia mojavensis]KAJ1742020.1 hypothetical protein LPJ68_002318 [Coemansia sp. RSA 1086]KAJ1750244.1 hypothetical protein LPJ79_003080 [Coemansia sp. RSA 1821]KAJ2669305.1 hypothetical protein IWW42_004688 [Coemansia sp. RSA 1085]
MELEIAPCNSTRPRCNEGQIAMLTESNSECKWTCQADPLYTKPANNKWPIIGGSLGAMLFVLALLLALLLLTYMRKRRRERLAFLKDTEDLASELSDQPLLAAYPIDSTGSSATSEPASFWGLRGTRWKSGEFFVAKAPAPGDAGTELSMDIVDRPPESDPTLAIAEGVSPYRQEKTASAYPLLSKFSTELSGSLTHTPNAGKPPQRLDIAMADYNAARFSGNIALAAARHSALSSPATGAFDPFHAVPGVGNSPKSSSHRSSQRTSKHSSI